ncbi:hypothetical protein DSL72_001726 [Monilinia vaccinii-corymbosi]|uniref:lipoyl(octanoyl) transferase n=1 Tax=Monilinia vaccinii-corymbosi TaxID=61207 RepID=A0A8A3P2Q1_9HELO|nr:hypothetical protein DSL72_001726 [Monilinia vaccinii-corymbosi]
MVPLPPSTIPNNLIRHIHLKGITPFHIAQTIQSTLVSKLLRYKKETSIPQNANTIPPAPPPTILTFQSTPVYTTGRRELQKPLSETLLKTLREPLIPVSTSHLPTIRDSCTTSRSKEQKAEVVQTPRGGLITFHGPGQLVIYPVIDLLAFPNLGARCYVNLLEESTIQLLRKHGLGVMGRSENPGVWVNEGEKIASLGVHLRRHVSSYGVGLNLILERGWWDRIKACGLDGKRIVGMSDEFFEEGLDPLIKDKLKVPTFAAQWWVKEFANGLRRLERGEKCDGSESVSLGEDHDAGKQLEWTGWGDIPDEVKQLIPVDIRGGNELKISTGGGFVQYRVWR